jgi:hypothetical protein
LGGPRLAQQRLEYQLIREKVQCHRLFPCMPPAGFEPATLGLEAEGWVGRWVLRPAFAGSPCRPVPLGIAQFGTWLGTRRSGTRYPTSSRAARYGPVHGSRCQLRGMGAGRRRFGHAGLGSRGVHSDAGRPRSGQARADTTCGAGESQGPSNSNKRLVPAVHEGAKRREANRGPDTRHARSGSRVAGCCSRNTRGSSYTAFAVSTTSRLAAPPNAAVSRSAASCLGA